MRNRTLKLGAVAATALGAALPLLMASTPAYADYAPTPNDVVGVGSDTLQYMLDFVADGFPGSSSFYNGLGNKYKLDNVDATADANARLAYGPDGKSGTAGLCAPGTSSTFGTGTATSGHGTGLPCVLNPSVVLREGTDPVQRPNGSTAGYEAICNDIVTGGNVGGTGASTSEQVNYVRASSALSSKYNGSSGSAPCVLPTNALDSVSIGQEQLDLLTTSNTGGTPSTNNTVPLSVAQLKGIYTTSIGGTQQAPFSGTGCVTWNEVGGTSSDPILPIIPQLGSGTRSTFETAIGFTDATVGSCVQTFEENDPTAIYQATNITTEAMASVASANAVEPMSGGRLNLFQGQQSSLTTLGTSSANALGAYFLDPSCPVEAPIAACTAGAKNNLAGVQVINPAVHFAPAGTATGTGGGTQWTSSRPLYIYFRAADVDSTTPWQPGAAADYNWVRVLFFNPCDPSTGGFTSAQCTNGGTNGPGGAPYVDTPAGQAQIALAGVTPNNYAEQAGGA